MQKLLIATTSQGKLAEIRNILNDVSSNFLLLSKLNLSNLKVKETGQTFKENAILKAKTYGQASNLLTLADDSGLCVDALKGGPGVYSSRYIKGSDKNRWRKLLKELDGLPLVKRKARFISVVALYLPKTKEVIVKKGICQGRIGFAPKGENGFGYDPVFVVDKLKRHFAELSLQEKNQVSHRAQAMKKIKPILQRIIKNEVKT